MEKSSAKRIMIVTGETSGDLHGAKLIEAVRKLDPEISFFGVGGGSMAAAGCEILIPGEELAVVGIVEVLEHFPLIWRSLQRLKKLFSGARRPDALVLIDFPDFNLRLAVEAKKAGVPVLYYISPQVWAWRKGRVKKIAGRVDSLAAILPFEPDLYDGYDIHVEYVGHPLLDEFSVPRDREALLKELDIDPERRLVGLFPGSRRSELKYMLETLVASARLMHRADPALNFIVPVAPSLSIEEMRRHFDEELPVTLIKAADAGIYELASACDAVLTVSGTVTLQVALAGTPMAILYKLSPLTYRIGRCLIKVDDIGLVNIVAGQRIVPEFIQDEANPAALSAAILDLLNDAAQSTLMRTQLAAVRERLGTPGCSDRVARMILQLTTADTMERVS
jgi:lipid-A-disaccharide synthase